MNSSHHPSSWRCGKCIKKHNALSTLGQVASDHGQPSSQLRQVSPLQALSSTNEPLSNKEHPAKRRKIDRETRVNEQSRSQEDVRMTNSDGCGSYDADANPPTTQATVSAGINPIHLDIPKSSKQSGSTESISDPRIASKVGSPSPRPSMKRDVPLSQQNNRAPDPRTEELTKRAAKDSHLMHLMKEVGAGRASEAQVKEFRYYVVTLCGPAKTQPKTSTPGSPKSVSGSASRGHVEVKTEPSDSHHHRHNQHMPFQRRQAVQRRFIDPQSNELSPPYSPLPARQFEGDIPELADAATQVDLHPEMCDPGFDQSITVEATHIVEPSNDTKVQTDRRLSLDNPMVPLTTCSKCKKRVFSGNTKAMGIVLW